MTEKEIADAIRSIANHALDAYMSAQYKTLKKDLLSLKELANTIHKE